MITVKTLPLLLRIVGKLDLKPVIEPLKSMDIFSEPESGEDALKQLSKEKIGVLGMTILAEITPQLGKIADDIPLLIAAYKDIPIGEANKLDSAEVLNDIIHDDGIKTFFSRLLKKKLAPEA
jgi:hypothetical protein